MKMSNKEKALSVDAPTDKALQQLQQKTKSNENVLQRNTKFKKRNLACVIYPESLPENRLEILQKTGLKVTVVDRKNAYK